VATKTCIECEFETDDTCFLCDEYVCDDCSDMHLEFVHEDEES
jgi:hypothetical protein